MSRCIIYLFRFAKFVIRLEFLVYIVTYNKEEHFAKNFIVPLDPAEASSASRKADHDQQHPEQGDEPADQSENPDQLRSPVFSCRQLRPQAKRFFSHIELEQDDDTGCQYTRADYLQQKVVNVKRH